MTRINYNNTAAFYSEDNSCGLSPVQPILIKDELKLFAYKYIYSEADCGCSDGQDCYPGKGDDVGFTLVFGNYGERTYCPPEDCEPTVEDLLDLTGIVGSSLAVTDICLPEGMKLVVVATTNTNFTVPTDVVPGIIFEGGYTYTLQVQQNSGGGVYTPCFSLQCHSVCCISVLFQVEFTDCTNHCCDDLQNGSFEDEESCTLDHWNTSIASDGGFVSATTDYTFPNDFELNPYDGSCFALLAGGAADEYTSIKQTFNVEPGQTLSFSAFFYLGDSSGYDEAMVVSIKTEGGATLGSVTHTANYISEDWETFAWDVGAYHGCITFEAKVKNTVDEIATPYLAIDNVQIL